MRPIHLEFAETLDVLVLWQCLDLLGHPLLLCHPNRFLAHRSGVIGVHILKRSKLHIARRLWKCAPSMLPESVSPPCMALYWTKLRAWEGRKPTNKEVGHRQRWGQKYDDDDLICVTRRCRKESVVNEKGSVDLAPGLL
jgi:hypothetical protein